MAVRQAQAKAKTQVNAKGNHAAPPVQSPLIGGDDPDNKFEAYPDEDEVLAKIRDQLDEDSEASWVVSVHAQPPTGGGKAEYLFTCGVHELEGLRDRLRDEEGTGTYVARIKCSGQVRGVLFMRIRGRPKAVVSPGVAPEMQQIMAALKQQGDAIIMLAQRPPPAPAQQQNMKEMVETLVALKGLTADASTQTEISRITEMVKLAREIGGSDREPGLLESLAPLAGKFFEALPTLTAQAQPPAAVRAIEAQPAEPQPAAPPVSEFPLYLRMLVSRAREECDPALYAYVLRDVIPEAELPRFRALGRAVITLFEQSVPEIAQFREWFAELVDNFGQIMARDEGLPGNEGNDAPEPAGQSTG